MRISAIAVLCLLFWACNTPPEEVGENNTPAPVAEAAPIVNDTLKNLPEPSDTQHVVLFGRGSEPGWTCEFYGNRIIFIFDYGKDSLIVRGLNFSFHMQDPKFFNEIKIESRNRDTSFATLPGPCKEESTGDLKPLKMMIKLGVKEFNGCAWIPE